MCFNCCVFSSKPFHFSSTFALKAFPNLVLPSSLAICIGAPCSAIFCYCLLVLVDRIWWLIFCNKLILATALLDLIFRPGHFRRLQVAGRCFFSDSSFFRFFSRFLKMWLWSHNGCFRHQTIKISFHCGRVSGHVLPVFSLSFHSSNCSSDLLPWPLLS